MNCRCFIVRRGITVGAWESCTNWDLHPNASGESPIGDGVAIARQIVVAVHAKKTWADVDAVAIRLAAWLPSSPAYAKPGNAPRLPEELQLCLIANDAEDELAGDVDADAIRAQIEPDLRWHACSRRPLNLAGQATAIRTLDRRHGDSRERAWGLDFQRRIEAREWDEGYRMRRFGDENGAICSRRVNASDMAAGAITHEQLKAGAVSAAWFAPVGGATVT